MKKTVVTKLGPGKIADIKNMPDGSFEIVQLVDDGESKGNIKEQELIEGNLFVLIEASKLSPLDDFMQHDPRTEREKRLKGKLLFLMAAGIKDFYRPSLDPSFTEGGYRICYVEGSEPAVGKSYVWWEYTAKYFWPERNSRLGTEDEYIAFLGVLIKKMVESGKCIEWAWNVVCNDSKEIGHYWNSKDGKYDLEHTGARCSCDLFYDLANTHKILAASNEWSGIFTQASGSSCSLGKDNPLFSFFEIGDVKRNLYNSVGWIVMD